MARLIAFIFLFSFADATAQTDTTLVIDEILIVQQSIRNSAVGSLQEVILPQQLSLAQAIERLSNTYIKNYGAGSLSTPSIRGGSAGQTLVLWNGLPLHSPMLGLLDFSLIPNLSSSKVTITKGGSSSLWGSGAVSGLISLDSDQPLSNQVSSTTNVGSFGTLGQNLSLSLSSDKWKSRSSFSHESAERDFSYSVSPALPEIKQTNGRYHRNHLTQDIYYLANSNHQLSAHIWAYEASTQIPPTTVQNKSEAYQEDRAVRSIVEWKYVGSNLVLNSKLGHFVDHNNYYDPATATEAANRFSTTFADVSLQQQFANHTFTIGSTYSSTSATAQGYQDMTNERRLGLFVTHLYEWSKLQVQTSIRQEFVDAATVPILPSVGISFEVASWLKSRGKISRDFRSPTLNDRYWRPGGDSTLLPESGWSQEIGMDLLHENKTSTIAFELTIFNRDMDNWIMWTPTDGRAFWSAKNINNVKSWGVEQSLSVAKKVSRFDFLLDVQYSYISSTFQSTLTLPAVMEGDQLFYTPRHQGRVAFRASLDGISFDYIHSLTGSTSGVNEQIPSFQTANLDLRYNTKICNTKTGITLSINNLWDNNYFIIERRPLPGRHYNISITVSH